MKRTLFLSLILSVALLPVHALEWNSSTSENQTVSEDVTVTGEAPVGDITFDGDSTVSGEGSIGGSGTLTVNSGTVVFDGVSRTGTGNITIESGATLEAKNSAKLLSTEYNNATVTVKGTLKLYGMSYEAGGLGALKSNSEALVLVGNEQYASSPRLEITGSGEADRGVTLQDKGGGKFFTVALSGGGLEFSWNKFFVTENGVTSEYGKVESVAGRGNALIFDVGKDSVFTLNKDIGAGLRLAKTGEGTLVVNGTINLESGRWLAVDSGTLKLGDDVVVTSFGDFIQVAQNATFDLNGKAGQQGLDAHVSGNVINGQNNEMNITLTSTGVFNISADAESGYNGTLVLAKGSIVDLGNYAFFNSIDLSAGGELLQAENHRGSIILGVDEVSGVTAVDSADLNQYSSSLASAGSIEASLADDFTAESPEFALLKGRLYAAESLSIAGNGAPISVSISGYQSEYGAMSAQNGDITIADVVDVTLSNNAATSETNDDYNRAGALSATGSVVVEASGVITISDNSASVNPLSAGAVYAGGGDVSLSGASITITGNSVGSGDAAAPDSCSGGAIRSDYGIVYLTSTEGDIVISRNKADESGGALYASTGVEIVSAADIEISGNTATNGDGGAIYALEGVSVTPGEGGSVAITDNVAGTNGGAIYSYGDVSLSGGPMLISGNTAGSAGGAIYAEGNVSIKADAGNIIFSGNTACGEANDIELGGGTAALSASNGNTLELQGGVTCAAEINISTDDNSTVKLGGTSSTESLTIENGRVHGIYDADGNQAVINVSSSVTLDNACLQDIALVDEYGEASLTSTTSTYVYNDAVAMLFGALEEGEAGCYTSSAALLNGFASIDGELAVGMTLDFLQTLVTEAEGEAVTVSLTLVLDSTEIAGAGFTFSLDAATLAMLDCAMLDEYGFYDADGNLLDATSVTLTEVGNVVFSIKGLTDAVPEPATTTLSLLALSALCLRRRRQK